MSGAGWDSRGAMMILVLSCLTSTWGRKEHLPRVGQVLTRWGVGIKGEEERGRAVQGRRTQESQEQVCTGPHRVLFRKKGQTDCTCSELPKNKVAHGTTLISPLISVTPRETG